MEKSQMFDQRLVNLLEKQIDKMSSTAEENGTISTADLDYILALAAAKSLVPDKNRRWIPVTLFLLTALLTSLLLIKVKTVNLEIQANTDIVTFSMQSDSVLAGGGFTANELVVIGFSKMQPTIAANNYLTLRASDEGAIIVSELNANDSPVITVASESAGFTSLSIPKAKARLEVQTQGTVCVVRSVGTCDQIDPQILILRFTDDDLQLYFSLRNPAQAFLSEQHSLRSFGLLDPALMLSGSQQGILAPQTGLDSGTVYFTDLSRMERKLRPGEILKFQGFSGVLQSLRIRDGRLRVSVVGEVTDLISHTPSGDLSLKPNYLNVMSAEHNHLWSAWVLIAYFFSLIWGVLRWAGVN